MSSPFDEPDEVEFSTIEEAVSLLDQWIAAHRALEISYRQLQWKYDELLDRYRHARAAINNDLLITDLQAQNKKSFKSRFD